MKIKIYTLLVFSIVPLLFAQACSSGGGASPNVPTQVPTTIEYAGAELIAPLGGSMTLSADADFTAGQVKFTDLSTGEEDTSGICGTAAVNGTEVVLTAPNDWPNLQSQCGVCFEYDGQCLPVESEAAASEGLMEDLSASLATNEAVATYDAGLNVELEIVSTNDMQFVNSSGQVVPEWGYIIGPYLADYEDRSDPANVVSEKHFCASLITQNSNTGIWERSRIVYNKSSDNFATATTPINITEDSDYMTQGCYMDVEKINGEKVIAVSAVGRGCSECSGYRSVLFKKNLRTESFDRGPEIGYITQEQVESGAYSYTRIELASDGGVHAFYMANYDLYYKKCTMTSCSDPVLVASDIATQLENDFNAFSFIKYDEVLYVAYATDDDGNGLTDVMLKTLPENSLTFSSEIKISSADAVKGSAKGVAVDVYRAYVDDQRIAEELIEEELIARELIVVIAYTYETENKAYISVSVGNTIDFGNEEEFAGPTDSSETGGVMAAAALISELGYVSVSFLIAGVGHDYRDVKYRPMEIVSDPDNSGKYTVDFGGRTAIPYSRTVIEHSSGFTSSRVGRTAVLYCKSEHISDAEGYDVDGVGIEISRVKGSQ